MVKQVLSILLATSIVACPVLCGRGAACCGTVRASGVHACCEACRDVESNGGGERDSAPSHQDSGAPKQCNGCICGGAVVDDVSAQNLVVTNDHWIAIPTAFQLLSAASDLRPMPNPKGPLPDDDMNPGRAMRCIMSSYLC
jgi:hypothetical protein